MTQILGANKINVGQMQVSRKNKGEIALMTCELDDLIDERIIEEIRQCNGISTVTLMSEA